MAAAGPSDPRAERADLPSAAKTLQETRTNTGSSPRHSTEDGTCREATYPQLRRSKGFSALEQERDEDVWLQSNYPLKEITINSELPNYRGQANLGNH